MAILTKANLKLRLAEKIRSNGVGGLTTALDHREFETDFIDSIFKVYEDLALAVGGFGNDYVLKTYFDAVMLVVNEDIDDLDDKVDAIINDTVTNLTSTWSSSKIAQMLNNVSEPLSLIPVRLDPAVEFVVLNWNAGLIAKHGTRPIDIVLYETYTGGQVKSLAPDRTDDGGANYYWFVRGDSARVWEIRIKGFTLTPIPDADALDFGFDYANNLPLSGS